MRIHPEDHPPWAQCVFTSRFLVALMLKGMFFLAKLREVVLFGKVATGCCKVLSGWRENAATTTHGGGHRSASGMRLFLRRPLARHGSEANTPGEKGRVAPRVNKKVSWGFPPVWKRIILFWFDMIQPILNFRMVLLELLMNDRGERGSLFSPITNISSFDRYRGQVSFISPVSH